MPLRPASEPYRDERVEAFFDNLLPDSRAIRERIQRRFATSSGQAFDLLAEIGRDCVGAIQLHPVGEQPPNVRECIVEDLTRSDVARILEKTVEPGFGRTIDDESVEFRISLAGAQEKTALLWRSSRWHLPLAPTPSTHILKLPIGTANRGIDLSTSVENEWLCGQILQAFDLRIASSRIETFGGFKVLVVERFDRRLSEDGSWWIRLPQEDLCQATGTPSALKYESDGGPSAGQILRLLLGSENAESDRRSFFKTLVIFWMLCAIDGHAKNFSIFLLPAGGFRLTPLYDVLSAFPVLGHKAKQLAPEKVKMAMALEGTRRHYRWSTMQRRYWLDTAANHGLQGDSSRILDEAIESTPGVIDTVSRAIPKGFPTAVAEAILDGVRRSATRLKGQIG